MKHIIIDMENYERKINSDKIVYANFYPALSFE